MQANGVKSTTDKKWIDKWCSDVHGDLLLVNRAPLIKAPTSTGWGKQKETLMATNKAVMRPALGYAIWSSIWSTLASSTSIKKLQVMQNTALRTAPGCTQATNIQHLHDETLILPIDDHLKLHAYQYKQKTQHPSHPLHKHTTYFNTPRLKTLPLTTLHNKHSHRPPHSHHNRHINKHASYTYIYCLLSSIHKRQ